MDLISGLFVDLMSGVFADLMSNGGGELRVQTRDFLRARRVLLVCSQSHDFFVAQFFFVDLITGFVRRFEIKLARRHNHRVVRKFTLSLAISYIRCLRRFIIRIGSWI